MSWVATAVIASAVIGGVSQNRAAGKAADAARRGQDILAASRAQGRSDVLGVWPQAQESQTKGFEEFRDFIANQSMQQQAEPFIGGNMAAQRQISRGLPQIQNALLGMPTDLSGFRARQVGQTPQFDVSRYMPPSPEQAAPANVTEPAYGNVNLNPSYANPHMPILNNEDYARLVEEQNFRNWGIGDFGASRLEKLN